MRAIAYYEGTKALRSVHWIVRELPPGCLQVVEVISAERLASEFGYEHQAFRFLPFAKDAGNMTVLYDGSGRFWDYQCAFNMFGNSYMFSPSEAKLEEMPLYQKYVVLHEIGHGSMAGGGIWTRAKSIAASGVIACAFALITTELTLFGTLAVAFTLLVAYVSSVKAIVESEAEVFADSFAIRHIAKGSTKSAVTLVRKLRERLADDHLLERYDQLINKSRLRNLKLFEQRLAAGKSLSFIAHPSIRWLHYVAAILVLWWTVRDARPDLYSGWLSAAFGALIIAINAFRNFTIRQMLILDGFIRSHIGR
jgi:hypothetical protein